jgi:putative transposase
MSDERPSKRKRPASGVIVSADGPTNVFDTICTKERIPWLATNDVHDLLCKTWLEAEAWLVGRYVVMPDHIHLFAAPGAMGIEYENWVKYWKSQFTKAYKDKLGCDPPSRWQSNDWDTRLRSWESYDRKWDYTRNNPVRHRLVERAEDWPFQGELYELRWE